MKEPKCVFENLDEAKKCLDEWQERLFLTDWHIQLNLGEDDITESDDLVGYVDYSRSGKTAYIGLANKKNGFDSPKDKVTKYCAEKTLVHELLHIKMDVICGCFTRTGLCLEQIAFYESQHALLEQMAKSLIMAKYNVDFDWFKNF